MRMLLRVLVLVGVVGAVGRGRGRTPVGESRWIGIVAPK